MEYSQKFKRKQDEETIRDLAREIERQRAKILELEAENANLRAKLEADTKLLRAISIGCESALNRIKEESCPTKT